MVVKNCVPDIRLLKDLVPAYEKLAYIIASGEDECYSYEDWERELATWKMQLILDCRICGADEKLLVLDNGTHKLGASYDLIGAIDAVHDTCLCKLGFKSEEYSFSQDDEESMGIFCSEVTDVFMDRILEGDVFEADTVYLSEWVDFIAITDNCEWMSYVSVRLFKSAWYGSLIEQAKVCGLEMEACYLNMCNHLNRAFGVNGVYPGQSSVCVNGGVYAAYITFFDWDDENSNFTWCDIAPDIILQTRMAYHYAKQLEARIAQCAEKTA